MKPKSLVLALFVMAMWGSLFPFVKLGYTAFGVDTSSIPSILLFAGLRFTICGIAIIVFAIIRGMDFKNLKKVWISVAVTGIFSVTFHYGLQYLALSVGEGSKSAIIKQIGSVLAVFASAVFFKSDRLTLRKILGTVIGFAGIVLINLDSGLIPSVADLLIILSAIFSVAATFISKKSFAVAGAVIGTGVSQLAGGIILTVLGLSFGGTVHPTNFNSFVVFGYICIASVASYCSWYYLVCTESLSRLYITKFAEPVLAAILSAMFLGENPLRLEYFLAFACITAGIVISRRPDKAEVKV